jgi:hypothetical protein
MEICSMAKLVFGMNQSLDGYVDHMAFAPSPTLFRHFIEEAQGQAGSVYGRQMYEVMRYWDDDEYRIYLHPVVLGHGTQHTDQVPRPNRFRNPNTCALNRREPLRPSRGDAEQLAQRSCSRACSQSKHQGQRVRRRRLKPVTLVELLGALMQRMNQQRPHPGVARDGHGAIDGVLKQRHAELLPLGAAIRR